MKLPETAQALVKAFEEFEIIDAHEHLPPEEDRTSEPVDVTVLFSVYTRTDLVTAGMRPADLEAMLNTALPLDDRHSFRAHLDQFGRACVWKPGHVTEVGGGGAGTKRGDRHARAGQFPGDGFAE